MVYRLPLPSFQESYPATAVKFRTVDIGDINNVAVVACKSLCVFYFSLSLSLSSDSSGHVHQWHVSTGKSLNHSIEKRQTLAAAYSCDSSTYATSGSDCKLMVYDTPTGRNTATLEAR